MRFNVSSFSSFLSVATPCDYFIVVFSLWYPSAQPGVVAMQLLAERTCSSTEPALGGTDPAELSNKDLHETQEDCWGVTCGSKPSVKECNTVEVEWPIFLLGLLHVWDRTERFKGQQKKKKKKLETLHWRECVNKNKICLGNFSVRVKFNKKAPCFTVIFKYSQKVDMHINSNLL